MSGGCSVETFLMWTQRANEGTPTSSVLIGQVRKPPDIPQPDRVADHGEEVVRFAGPVSSLGVLVIFLCNPLCGQGEFLWEREESRETGSRTHPYVCLLTRCPRKQEPVGSTEGLGLRRPGSNPTLATETLWDVAMVKPFLEHFTYFERLG